MEEERNLRVNKNQRTLQNSIRLRQKKQYKNNGHSRHKREREGDRELIQRNIDDNLPNL